jgi:glycosyltransferase involved in cell wall biosynthesis
MKILIAAASFAANMSGLQRHALNVARCLLPEPEISSLHFVIAPWQLGMFESAGLLQDARMMLHVAHMDRSSVGRNLWYYRRLPKLAAELQADLVHLSYPMPVDAGAFHCPTLVTLHDLYPYQIPMNFGFPKFMFNRVVLQQCLRNVDSIACVSQATLHSLKQYVPIPVWKKAVRLYNCVEAQPVLRPHPPIPGWQNDQFLLCVAQHRRNKNLPLLIRTFHRMLRMGHVGNDMKLVIVGIRGPETRNIHRLVSALRLDARVSFLEGVSESELQWFYRQCQAVVSPSAIEGFGLPIAEALLAGCRVVCSDIPAYQEVGDEQCRFVSLERNAEETLAEAIVATLKEPKGSPRPLKQFSAPVLGPQYVGLYRRLMKSKAPLRIAGLSAQADQVASGRQPL